MMSRYALFALPFALLLGCPPDSPEDDDDTGNGADDDDDDDTWWTDDDDHAWPDDDDTVGDDDDDDTTGPGDDVDGDGYTTADGDCNDQDPSINPGEPDICDDEDNDCDTEVNEDSDAFDQYEPHNDAQGYDLGEMTGLSETFNSFIHAPGDEDRFEFYIYDGMWDYFGIDVELVTVPPGADMALELLLIEDAEGNNVGLVDEADDGGEGVGEALEFGGTAFVDDSGTYEVRVVAPNGYNCNVPYILVINCSG